MATVWLHAIVTDSVTDHKPECFICLQHPKRCFWTSNLLILGGVEVESSYWVLHAWEVQKSTREGLCVHSANPFSLKAHWLRWGQAGFLSRLSLGHGVQMTNLCGMYTAWKQPLRLLTLRSCLYSCVYVIFIRRRDCFLLKRTFCKLCW